MEFRAYSLLLGAFFKHFLEKTEQEYWNIVTYFQLEGKMFIAAIHAKLQLSFFYSENGNGTNGNN